ncbi:hypothetical protein NQ840_07885 [Acinetobacter baumannii]|nr:hypothetical protein [Acinetobacter baumannii]
MDNYKNREFIDPSRGYLYIALAEHEVKENMLGHEKWIEIPAGAELYVYWRENDTYNFQVDKSYFENGSWQPCAWTVQEIKSDKAGAKILWQRATQAPALISGADALRALADGKEVEYRYGTSWESVTGNQILITAITGDKFEFRLKPQTIKVELELPKPFEPKDGDIYWFITCRTEKGYSCRNHKARHGDSGMQFGAYRTEAEVKQVVEQLRKIRGTNS